MEAQALLDGMTTEEKVAQLFFIAPEAIVDVETVTQCGDKMREALTRYPVGGIVLFANNLETPEQTREMLAGMQSVLTERSGVPAFLSVDEEGGIVRRVGIKEAFGVPQIESMGIVAADGTEAVTEAAQTIGNYLSDLGFNTDFAPVADILTNPENRVIGERAFSSDPQDTAEKAFAYAEALTEQGVFPVYKHFPGHGDTAEDSHTGYAFSYKTLDELREAELIPFVDAAKNKIPFIMAAHISLPNVTGDDTPASLSPVIITDLLRNNIGYEGIIITDALDMGAISNHYTPGEASVKALEAGCDMLLMAGHFEESYQEVLAAVESGVLTQERINESVLRILLLKTEM